MPYKLITDTVSDHTVTALEELLKGARDGSVVGIAFAAILKGRRYMVDCCGSACADPTLTRGIVAALDDELRDMIYARIDNKHTSL